MFLLLLDLCFGVFFDLVGTIFMHQLLLGLACPLLFFEPVTTRVLCAPGLDVELVHRLHVERLWNLTRSRYVADVLIGRILHLVTGAE